MLDVTIWCGRRIYEAYRYILRVEVVELEANPNHGKRGKCHAKYT